MQKRRSVDRQRKGDTGGQRPRIITKPSSDPLMRPLVDPRWASEYTLRLDYKQALRYVTIGHLDPHRPFSASVFLRELESRSLPIFVWAADDTLAWATRAGWLWPLGQDVYTPIRGGVDREPADAV